MDQPISDVEEYIRFGTPPGADQDCDFLQQLAAKDQPGAKVLLDLACGVGRHALRMAQRGFTVTGVDLSAERIAYAQAEARRLGLANCSFVVADLRTLRLERKADIAYSLFNTFSLFVSNDELIDILAAVRNCLIMTGRLVVQLGSIWSYIAEGIFRNETQERTEQQDALVQKQTWVTQIARTNNIYRHNCVIQYTKDGVEYPPKSVLRTQRMFSANEWDLLCRLTGFAMEARYTRMDLSSKMGTEEIYDGTDHDHVYVLRKQST